MIKQKYHTSNKKLKREEKKYLPIHRDIKHC